MQERVPLFESVQENAGAELSADATFGPRLRRAVLLLTAAISAHLWLVHAPARGPLSIVAAKSSTISRSGLSVMPERLSAMPERTHAGTSAGMHAPSVRVRTEFISVGASDTHRVTLPPEVPVATMGVMQARAELTPAAESPLAVTDTLTRSLLVGLKTHPLPELALAETRSVANEVVEEIPAAPLAPAERVDNAPRDASSVASVSPAVD